MKGEGDRVRSVPKRVAITVSGAVQGVGFRPFVHGLATRLGLRGFVKNRSGDVFIEVEGDATALERFEDEVARHPPPLARVDDFRRTSCPPANREERDFRIEKSDEEAGRGVVLPPDLATCDACLGELFDPRDRRHRYPFLNCTNCGPRLTIVTGVPYDRERTVMAPFRLCASCRAERDDPTDRRFHAQPIACPACGPALRLLDGEGRAMDGVDPIGAVIDRLDRGAIVGIKGLGGYHLACDAENEAAVTELRRRKRREEKPFAVMIRDVASAEAVCEVSLEERAALESPARPIVILRRRSGASSRIASAVSPDDPTSLGVMLPYTPIHHLLLREGSFGALVMTSGNRSDEPIAYLDGEVVDQLRGIADSYLTHDRPIEMRCDDSVVRFVSPPGGPLPLRRSRGYAPLPVRLPAEIDRPTLAVGGDLKSTFALADAGQAVLSHHLGDLAHYTGYRAYTAAVDHYERIYRIAPRRIVHDLHPDYASTRYAIDRARRSGLELLAVQHHHAHMASCMLEHRLEGPVIGVCFDGAGLGLDGTLWGGEFLVGGYREASRVAHFRQVRMPGGDVAAREPWRMAVAHMMSAGEDPARSDVAGRVGAEYVGTALAMLKRPFNAPLTSSVGRLFDAVASLTGVCDRASFEGQAAMRLEALATGVAPRDRYAFDVDDAGAHIDPAPVIRAIVDDVRKGTPAATVSRDFHSALARVVAATCRSIRDRLGVNDVVLGGGVFSNAILTAEVGARLDAGGFLVYRHRTVPPNDGGLSLGQMAIAAATVAGGI